MTELTPGEEHDGKPGSSALPNTELIKSLFIRTIGLTCLVAFVSFWTQAMGLIGADGIMPAAQTLSHLEKVEVEDIQSLIAHINIFQWIGTSDLTIHALLLLGTILSTCLSLGRFPRRCLAVIWLLYFSFFKTCQPFLSYQWDILLLELVFLAILLQSTNLNGPHQVLNRQASVASIWLLRLVLFKLIWSSGVVKITSLDPTWQNLTALDFHFWTQPIPHQGAWYAYQLGSTFRLIGVWINHFVELAMPWLIIFSLSRTLTILWLILTTTLMWLYVDDYTIGVTLLIGLVTLALWIVDRGLKTTFETARWGRKLAGVSIIALMCSVGFTGNYGFFNLMTAGLGLACFMDGDLEWLPQTVRKHLRMQPQPPRKTIINLGILTVILSVSGVNLMKITQQARRTSHTASRQIAAAKVNNSSSWWTHLNDTTQIFDQYVGPLMLVNTYGLFARMTTERFELQVQGSNDGKKWSTYRFKYKPNTVADLTFAGFHMPRLDWQMWFAALYPTCSRRWLFYLMDALFDGSKPVLSLLDGNPFPNTPPRYIRIQRSKRRFIESEDRLNRDAFWKDTASETAYCPMVDQSTLSRSKLTRFSGN